MRHCTNLSSRHHNILRLKVGKFKNLAHHAVFIFFDNTAFRAHIKKGFYFFFCVRLFFCIGFNSKNAEHTACNKSYHCNNRMHNHNNNLNKRCKCIRNSVRTSGRNCLRSNFTKNQKKKGRNQSCNSNSLLPYHIKGY